MPAKELDFQKILAQLAADGVDFIVIGGLGSIPGSLVAGILLGLVESLGSVLISPSYKDVYGFLMVLGILFVRPTGLFGEKQRLA